VPTRPLAITADADLLDDIVRLASAAGVEVQVAPDPSGARTSWTTAPFVLVGADLVDHCARARLPARQDVVIVARSPDGSLPWIDAESIRAAHIAVLPAAEEWLVGRLCDGVARGRGRVLAVVGGRGGAGASVLAASLAVTARRTGLDVLLVDADPLGGGVDLVLGWEDLSGLRWPDLVDARGPVNPPALVAALPGLGSLAVLSFDRREASPAPPEAMAAALDAGRRGRDLVVVDLPRRFDEAAQLALTSADHTFLVVPGELRACAAATRIAAAVRRCCPAVSVVVRGPVPGGVAAEEVARGLGLPLSGQLRHEPGLARAMERGAPPAATGRGPLAELCRSLLAEVDLGHAAVAA
jgi:secretion/DNA translocation related CpaE-like protein